MKNPLLTLIALAAASPLACLAAKSTDGTVAIDQTGANNGGVTPGDAPGFPITISQPGSYRLVGNLKVLLPGVTAIQVEASNVTIDLNGFVISGLVACSGLAGQKVCAPKSEFSRGVDAYSKSPTNVVVRNGHVRGFQYGVILTERGLVNNLTASDNSSYGISVNRYSIVSENLVTNNRTGIETRGANVIRNTVSDNGGAGIEARGGDLILDNVISGNGQYGLLAGGAAYGRNMFFGNAVAFSDGVKIALNACDAVPC